MKKEQTMKRDFIAKFKKLDKSIREYDSELMKRIVKNMVVSNGEIITVNFIDNQKVKLNI